MTQSKARMKTTDLVFIAVFAALMAICSWISIPMTIPFTLQTFAIFLAVSTLGGRRGTLSILIYLLLGMVGIPVFSGFKGGLGSLLGTTGGYLIGFLFAGLVMWMMQSLCGQKLWAEILSMLLGMFAYYAFGTVWFYYVYLNKNGEVALMSVLGWCVFPFILPDLTKMALALFMARRLRRLGFFAE